MYMFHPVFVSGSLASVAWYNLLDPSTLQPLTCIKVFGNFNEKEQQGNKVTCLGNSTNLRYKSMYYIREYCIYFC